MTKYIQITKATYPYCWYAKHLDTIYPVRSSIARSEGESYEVWKVLGTHFEILKSDCEEVALPTITEQPVCLDGDMGHLHTNKALRDLAHQVAQEYKASTGGNYWEFKEVFWNGCKAMEQVGKPNPAGAHLITTAQADTLVQAVKILEMRGEHSMAAMLRNDFPAVFAPAKTYHAGQRFAVDKQEYILCQDNLRFFLVSLTTGKPRANAIGREKGATHIDEVDLKFLASPHPFTLLPDTAALEEYNAHDSYLSEALKGGQP